MSEWRPIETAPKDGMRILLFGHEGVDIGHWFDLAEAWWRDQTAEYDNDAINIASPTHWQPLPAPPHD